MKRFISAQRLQQVVTLHDPIAKLLFLATTFHLPTIVNYEQRPCRRGARLLISKVTSCRASCYPLTTGR